ncbi:MAG: malonic semialdehyde reductase [Rickettsiales bacterium]|nr:malonic semialdehyde reductase [Rickettsiales bacterium]
MVEITQADQELLFTEARSHNAFSGPVPDELLKRVYDLCKWGPTSTNTCPMRILFVKSPEAKEKLKPCLAGPNVEKTMAAPVTAIIAYDLKFYEQLDLLSPHNKARTWFEGAGKEEKAKATAVQNGTLQGGYFLLAARSLGLDCGPMSGFDTAKCDEAFFAGTSWKSNFLVNLGYGDPAKLYPRGARLPFDAACQIA